MASSGTGCDPVVIESDENNSSQNELDSENNFKCCQGKKTYKAEDVLRLKKEKNVCWLFFHIGENAAGNGPDKTKVHCNLCARVINYHHSPTNLVSHMKGYHNKILDQAVKERENDVPKKEKNLITNYTILDKSKNVKMWDKSSNQYKEAIRLMVQWFCSSSRPTNIVNDKYFKQFLNFLCPEFDVPANSTIAKYIDKEYEKAKEDTLKALEDVEFVSVTTDGGTSSNAVSFQDTNVHFLDKDFVLQSLTLGVKENKEQHTAINYRCRVQENLEEFNVQSEVVCFTTDNEPKMHSAFKERVGNGYDL